MADAHGGVADQASTGLTNTVLVAAEPLDEAYDKLLQIGRVHCEPCQGGPEAVDVQWLFEGVTEILPFYDELGDGAEVVWTEGEGTKLQGMRARVREKG